MSLPDRYKTFQHKLRSARMEAGLTQSEVAKRLSKPQTYISKCELGERRVDIIELEEFARIYHKPLVYFANFKRFFHKMIDRIYYKW